ncbi:MAG: DUF4837 domain-containing protein [Flavobacteriaceae bacterium]|nr:DUF4837 domain-containing protein [Flavobacteriaceae bacterium]
MARNIYYLFIYLFITSCDNQKPKRYVSDSSGKINTISVVMSKSNWNGNLGSKTRDIFEQVYEGLPVDEPKFSIKYLEPKIFNGFTRQSRNIIEFIKDTIGGFNLYSDMYAKPQVLARIQGNDSDEMEFFLNQNANLMLGVFVENEFIEKSRRIAKSLSTEKTIDSRFGVKIKYPSAYKTVKDTFNFIWVQKPVSKGHLNLIVYSIPNKAITKNISNSILKIRDSIGKLYIPGRLKGSYMITEKAYRPYFFKTLHQGRKTYLTKGTWEVANDYMAGPFINYLISDTLNKRWICIEGFTFSPSTSKRNYMFELETIIKSTSFN